jgi:uncharacterized protein (DUF433 family)
MADAVGRPGLRKGVYSYQEAGRLLNVTAQRVSRWADGYVFKLKYGIGTSGPVLQAPAHDAGVLTFEELLELFFVRQFVGLGVALQHVRATAEALAHEIGPFPFSKKPLLVGGRELLVRTASGQLQRADVGQLIADFADWMCAQVQIEGNEVRRYFPPAFERKVFLDPKIHGGEPSITEFAIPTRIIYSLWKIERDLHAVADYHDISAEAVSLAVRYEGEWRLAA